MEKLRRLVIVGTGEMALLAHQYFTYDSPYTVVAFSAERSHLDSPEIEGLPVVPLEELAQHFPPGGHDAFVAISATGLNRLRTRLYCEVKAQGYTCASYVSTRAFVWKNARVGENSFIFEHNTIQPFVTIGNNVIMWSGNHVGHRTVIENNCFVASHVAISGFCSIGSSSFLGVNSTFNDRTSLAPDCVVASGALVTKSLTEPGRIYYGSPARAMEGKSSFEVAF